MNSSNSDRRRFLKRAGVAAGAVGIGALYQNCGDPSISLSQDAANSQGGGVAPLSIAPPAYSGGAGLSTIDGHPVQEAVTGSDLDIFIDFTLATHFSHADSAGAHEQFLLSVIVGRNRLTPYPQKWRVEGGKDVILAVLIYDRDTGRLIRSHRLNENSIDVNVLMMLPDAYLTTTRNVSVVIHHAGKGFIRRNFTMSKNLATPYSSMVPIFNASAPFSGANPMRPYVAGDGEASGGQGSLGLIHYPLIEILTEDTVRVTLGGVANRHPRISETHYIAGASLYDQDGHSIALTTSVSYGELVDYSIITFPRASIRARGITQIRTVVHDTFNGYLMGFLNFS